MNRHYEALIVLNTQAKEDNVKEMIERLESEFEKEGAKVEQVQKMDKRHFSYAAGALDYRQHYQRLEENKEKAPKKVAKSK